MLFLFLNAAVCAVCLLLASEGPAWLWAGLIALGVLAAQAAVFYRQSRTDDLTGLGNLRRLEDMERVYRRCQKLGVWYFDLDHLKQVNDNEGHSEGDRLLKGFAATLSGATGAGAMAYRIGGDEFLLILPDAQNAAPPLPDCSALCASWGFAKGQGKQLRELIVLAEREMYTKRRRNSDH